MHCFTWHSSICSSPLRGIGCFSWHSMLFIGMCIVLGIGRVGVTCLNPFHSFCWAFHPWRRIIGFEFLPIQSRQCHLLCTYYFPLISPHTLCILLIPLIKHPSLFCSLPTWATQHTTACKKENENPQLVGVLTHHKGVLRPSKEGISHHWQVSLSPLLP